METNFVLTLAQEDAPPSPLTNATDTTSVTQQPGGNGEAPAEQAPSPGIPPMFIILFGGLIVMIFFSMGGQRKEKKKREAMLAALQKGDRIQTVGGILATAVEVRDDHVVIKIDENTNTKAKVARSAIQAVLNDKNE